MSNYHDGPVVNVAIIGCGAISELFYAPAISALNDLLPVRVTSLVDPDPYRLSVLGKIFDSASQCKQLDQLSFSNLDLAVVASPQRFHAKQVVTLLQNHVHVLCEKPLSSNLDEASVMLAAAETSDRLLAVGLFRRFWPVTRYIKDLITGRDLGDPLRFHWAEGGLFNWPAATPSFFQKSSSTGGVFADLGSHVLDLLLHWFGEVAEFEYQDDAMGGLETNAAVELRFTSGVTGQVRLSRDTPIANVAWIEFERGSVSFQPGTVAEITLQMKHSDLAADASLLPAQTYTQCFAEQIRNICRAIHGEDRLLVPAREALPSMALIEQCYSSRRLMEQPWLSSEEWKTAQVLAD
ncbi:MAG: Gfo/Idh/MocA family protein [Cyanobacteriota bacterium]